MKIYRKRSKNLQQISEKLELRPKDPELWEQLGDLYDKSQVKFKKQAIFAYENALKYSTSEEQKGSLFYSLGMVNEELKDWKKAKIFFKKEMAHKFPGKYLTYDNHHFQYFQMTLLLDSKMVT